MQRVFGRLGLISLGLAIAVLVLAPTAGAVDQVNQSSSARAELAKQNNMQEASEIEALDQQFTQIKTTLTYFSLATISVVIACVGVISYTHYKKYKQTRKKYQKRSL